MSVLKKIGKVGIKTHEKTYEETRIEWNIADFFSLTRDENTFKWYSPSFSFADASWFLELFRRSADNPEFMALYISSNKTRDYPMEYELGLRNLDGSLETSFTGILKGKQIHNDRCEIIKLSELLRRKIDLLPSDMLKLACTLKREIIHSTQPKPKKLIKLDALSENFKDLFANGKSCDTTLLVKDKEYKAHKAVLVARSSVFTAMFQHEMSEKQTGVIVIPDCDPESFGKFLEFLYCGKLEALSGSSTLHLYETSDKYDVQELKTFCIECIIENLTVENLCEIAILADKYDDAILLSAIQDFFNENLNKIFETSQWECLMIENFRSGNKLLKEMSKMKTESNEL